MAQVRGRTPDAPIFDHIERFQFRAIPIHDNNVGHHSIYFDQYTSIQTSFI